MPKIVLKIIPALLLWGTFTGVILFIPYPENLVQANFSQITPFFAALFLALIFTLNIFLKNFLQSFSLTLGLIFILILKALDSLNLVTGILTLAATGLLLSYFKKPKHYNLTKHTKIPKLTHMR